MPLGLGPRAYYWWSSSWGDAANKDNTVPTYAEFKELKERLEKLEKRLEPNE